MEEVDTQLKAFRWLHNEHISKLAGEHPKIEKIKASWKINSAECNWLFDLVDGAIRTMTIENEFVQNQALTSLLNLTKGEVILQDGKYSRWLRATKMHHLAFNGYYLGHSDKRRDYLILKRNIKKAAADVIKENISFEVNAAVEQLLIFINKYPAASAREKKLENQFAYFDEVLVIEAAKALKILYDNKPLMNL